MTFPPNFVQATMRRALELAERGIGLVEPNPAVGAVIVNDAGQTLGEGWHQQFGGPHAEINALAAAGEAARGATLFVTLEPCCHFGKTPPCTRAVIAAGIRRVYVAMGDPAAHVNGQGLRELRESGIEVHVGLLESEARRLVSPFVQLMTGGRPWFHAKWAMSLDGKIATRTGHSQWISGESSRAVVHQLRGRMDAILVGIGTVLADDPLLTARPAGPRVATRVVLDSQARLPINAQLVRTVVQAPVLVVTTSAAPVDRCQSLRDAGVEILQIEADPGDRPSLPILAAELGRRRLTNILVEGGSQVLGALFDAGLIDEVHAFISPKLIGGATAKSPISGCGLGLVPQEISLDEPQIQILDHDVYVRRRVVHS